MASDQNIVYLIDADDSLGKVLKAVLDTYGIHVNYYRDGDSFLQALEAGQPEHCCLLMTLDIPDLACLSLMERLGNAGHSIPVILVGDNPDHEVRQMAIRSGALEVVDRALVSSYLFTSLAHLLPQAKSLPSTATQSLLLDNGGTVTFRMMHPDDAEREQEFVMGLSDRSRYLRFFSGLKKLPEGILEEFTHPDFPYSYAVIATVPEGDSERQVGVARYSPTGVAGTAEFAVVVADDWQGLGIASKLMRLVVTACTVAGFDQLEGLILKENAGMLTLAKQLGFRVSTSADHGAGPTATLVVKALREPD